MSEKVKFVTPLEMILLNNTLVSLYYADVDSGQYREKFEVCLDYVKGFLDKGLQMDIRYLSTEAFLELKRIYSKIISDEGR